MGSKSDTRELNGGSSWVFSVWLASGQAIHNCELIDAERVSCWVIFGGWLLDGKGGAGVSSIDAELGGILGERKVTGEIVRSSKPEGVRGWKSPSGSEKTEKQSSQGGKMSAMRP